MAKSTITEKKDGWQKITPQVATEMLMTSIKEQRKIKWSVVHAYARDMKAGLWRKNAEHIHFNSKGQLVNGQHRLQAIIESGVTVDLYVIYDVESSLFDVGYKRTMGDQLRIDGKEIPVTASAAAKIVIGGFKPIGIAEQNAYINKHEKELERAYNACCVGTNGRASKRAACVAATYLMLHADHAQYFELEMFWQVFNTRESRLAAAREASAILTARQMIDDMGEARNQRTDLEIFIRAMEDFLADRPQTTPYKIEVPYHWEKYVEEVREKDAMD